MYPLSVSPLSSACASALTCLFSSIISHTSQSWSNYSRLCGYMWFSFACRGDRDSAMWAQGLMAVWSASSAGVWHETFFLFVVTDSALDDFVLMHCVFIPNSQLCPVLMAQYPFSAALRNVVKAFLLCSLRTLFWSLTAVHLPCPGLTGLWAGEARLHAQQQAQSDPPGDAVGCGTRRSAAAGGRLRGLHRGQRVDMSNIMSTVITTDDKNGQMY